MKTLRIRLPLPPGVNNQYVKVGKRRVLSKPARAFHRDTAAVVNDLRSRGAIDGEWLDWGRLCCHRGSALLPYFVSLASF